LPLKNHNILKINGFYWNDLIFKLAPMGCRLPVCGMSEALGHAPAPPFSKEDVVLAIVETAHTLTPFDNAAFPPLKKGGRGDFIECFHSVTAFSS
jgi:hypothetical protein